MACRLPFRLLFLSFSLVPSMAEFSAGEEGAREELVCATVKQMVTNGEMPSDLYSLLQEGEAMKEYDALVKDLAVAKKSKVGSFKCSALYRNMYIGGHEKAFGDKGLSIFLTKEDKGGVLKSLRKSIIKVCFGRGTGLWEPDHTYSDARSIAVKGSRGHEVSVSYKPHGPVTQPLPPAGDSAKVAIMADKSTMPVDILKLLEAKKGAMMLHTDMAALVNMRKHDPKYAEKIVDTYEDGFKDLGLRVTLRSKTETTWTEDPDGRRYKLTETFYWLKYYDYEEWLGDFEKKAIGDVEVVEEVGLKQDHEIVEEAGRKQEDDLW